MSDFCKAPPRAIKYVIVPKFFFAHKILNRRLEAGDKEGVARLVKGGSVCVFTPEEYSKKTGIKILPE